MSMCDPEFEASENNEDKYNTLLKRYNLLKATFRINMMIHHPKYNHEDFDLKIKEIEDSYK
jgi:hypothetical protein